MREVSGPKLGMYLGGMSEVGACLAWSKVYPLINPTGQSVANYFKKSPLLGG